MSEGNPGIVIAPLLKLTNNKIILQYQFYISFSWIGVLILTLTPRILISLQAGRKVSFNQLQINGGWMTILLLTSFWMFYLRIYVSYVYFNMIKIPFLRHVAFLLEVMCVFSIPKKKRNLYATKYHFFFLLKEINCHYKLVL